MRPGTNEVMVRVDRDDLSTILIDGTANAVPEGRIDAISDAGLNGVVESPELGVCLGRALV
jgi:hypothetical protein